MRRHRWEQTHKRVAICVDFDDAYSAAIRAGLSFDDMLAKLIDHGATHVSLPELTLNRLQASGQLTPRAPSRPRNTAPRVGHWNYLYGSSDLLDHLATELNARLSYAEAKVLSGNTLVFAGDLPTVGGIGLGFDATLAERMTAHGLGIVPRPVSYAWPEDALIDRTLSQAAALGNLIAFDGKMILGHEMHLDRTLNAMEREELSFVYFAKSRHQKGDWFIAKRRAPHVALAHRFTPEEMIPLDFHAAAHHWAYLAREHGIRFCYVNFFKVLHATEPLESLHYIEHIKEALEHDGFEVAADVALPKPVPTPERQDLALGGLATAGIAASATDALFDLPESIALPLTISAAAGAIALPYLERARSHLEEQYPPSYAPKALALATTTLAPIAALQALQSEDDRLLGWIASSLTGMSAAASLAALTSGQDYHLCIEEYRGLNLDWFLPMAYASLSIPIYPVRIGTLTTLGIAWTLARQRHLDPLGRIDPSHAEGHTHHLSSAARIVGDLSITLGPQPARKWSGLGPLAASLSVLLTRHGRAGWSSLAAMLSALGYAAALVGYRRSERALALTSREALPSFGIGAVLGLAALFLSRGDERRRNITPSIRTLAPPAQRSTLSRITQRLPRVASRRSRSNELQLLNLLKMSAPFWLPLIGRLQARGKKGGWRRR